MINRKELICSHNPILTTIDMESPLTVGNGELCFTADITGLQTLYEDYKKKHVPLCTMSQWGWHRKPDEGKYYSLDDVEMTEYDCNGRKVYYAVEKQAGNERIYDWLRENPHRLNLSRISFYWKGKVINPRDITCVSQELDLYKGILNSCFLLHGEEVRVVTMCHHTKDILGFWINSSLLKTGDLRVRIEFPYGSPDISASNWEDSLAHTSIPLQHTDELLYLKRQLDENIYFVTIHSENKCTIYHREHMVELISREERLSFTVGYKQEDCLEVLKVDDVLKSSKNGFRDFWERGGMVKFCDSTDKRAIELERRVILSLYLLYIQSCGSMPPQETGLTCNSWYGKFHLEMYPWHCAFLPLWGRSALLEKGFDWYHKHLPDAILNAKRNGYLGARWPKMVSYDAVDSPSIIATLLIWQQPHIIYVLELYYQAELKEDILYKYWDLIEKTAEFMCDFVVFNEATKKYDLPSPIIPAQEEHDPRITVNPSFELEYWHFGLKIAYEWSKRVGKELVLWKNISDNMADLPIFEEKYIAHENCKDTFKNFHKDHPSMLLSFGFLPGDRIDPMIIENTIKEVMECWDFNTMWGWDFALMAMTYVRLGNASKAMDILLMDTPKNSYVSSGNNYQRLRTDLPLYLAGNGSLLLAVAMMVGGIRGRDKNMPGIPTDGFTVEAEGILKFPY